MKYLIIIPALQLIKIMRYIMEITPPTTSLLSPPVIGFRSISFRNFMVYLRVGRIFINQKISGKIVISQMRMESNTHIAVLSNEVLDFLNIFGEFSY